MFYEEKLIDGVLHWRGTPDGEWLIVPIEKLRQRVVIAEAFRAEVAAALRELRELRNGLECIQERAHRMRGSASGDRPMKSATQACAWIAESTPALMKQLDATITALGLADETQEEKR